jgi:hypothetical protein
MTNNKVTPTSSAHAAMSWISKKVYRISIATLLIAGTFACSVQRPWAAKDLALQAQATVGCTNFGDELWDSLYRFLLKQTDFPSLKEQRYEFERIFLDNRFIGLSNETKQKIVDQLMIIYQTLTIDSLTLIDANDRNNHNLILGLLTSLEMGDRTSTEKSSFQDKIRIELTQLATLTRQVGLACPTPQPTPTPESVVSNSIPDPSKPSLLNNWKATRHPAVYGGLKTMATAYQSCTAGQIAPIDNLTSDLKGISIAGAHSDGIGKIRVITNLNAFIASNYYLRSYSRPTPSCFPVQRHPLIYDYGGKPSSGADIGSKLDLFTNSGTGSRELGIDCSGFIYSSLAAAGLKLKSSGRLKAIGVNGVSAKMYMNPNANGLNCFEMASFTNKESLKSGDIIASKGHVVMVESISPDPFGISDINKDADCRVPNISLEKFNFTIIQSSPSKEGIGINRMQAASFFKPTMDMAQGLLEHAFTACHAKFHGPLTTKIIDSTDIVRHKNSVDCIDSAIPLVNEDCAASCETAAAK